VRFLTVMMWGLHKLTDRAGEIENKNREEKGKKKMDQNCLKKKICHTVKQHGTIALDCACGNYLGNFFLCPFLPFLSDSCHPIFLPSTLVHSIS